LLGVSTNGVMPLAGPHDCNLDEQMKKYLNGYDIRNLPGLLAFSNRMDDMFEVVLDRGVKRPGFTTLDGVFHPIQASSAASLTRTWHTHGVVRRPYSAWIVSSQGFSIQTKRNVPKNICVQVNVTSPMEIAGRAYRNPRNGRIDADGSYTTDAH